MPFFCVVFFSPINLTLMSALDYRISLSMEWYDLHLLQYYIPLKIFILMISIMGVDQKASGVQFCWCFYILILIYTVKYLYFYGDVLEFFLGTSWCFLHTFLWYSIHFLHSYYCCVIVEFLLPFSCLNEISVPTSLSICVLQVWCPIRMEPIKYYFIICFLLSSENKGTRCINLLGRGVLL